MEECIKRIVVQELNNNTQYNRSKYTVKDVKTNKPKKNCSCYVIKIIDSYPHTFHGKFEDGKFHKARFTSAEKCDYDFKQQIYYEEIVPDAYVKYKNI